MIEILSLIKDYYRHLIDGSINEWISEILVRDDIEESYIVLPEERIPITEKYQRKLWFYYKYMTSYSKTIVNVLQTCHLKGIYDLGRPVLGDRKINLVLIVFSKNRYSNTCIGYLKDYMVHSPIFHVDRFLHGISKNLDNLFPPQFYPFYVDYIRLLESQLNGQSIGNIDTDYFEINSVNSSSITEIIPRLYSKQYRAIMDLIGNNQFSKLSDVANVFEADKEGKPHYSTVPIESFYHFTGEARETFEVRPSSYKLKKGDIVFSLRELEEFSIPQVYLYHEADGEIYAPLNFAVISCKKLDSTFLYFYLTSRTGQFILEDSREQYLYWSISIEDLVNCPVIIQKRNGSLYEKQYYALTDKLSLDYEYEKNFSFDNAADLEDILNVEIVEKIRIHNSQLLRRMIIEDITELNSCYRGGAFKATLIMAGSILEALLIDWLSEIDGNNYFQNPYMVRKGGRFVEANLVDYIRAIKLIKQPDWAEEAHNADIIRKKRNLVHAKLCLRESAEINDVTCREVVGYLMDIIKTRGINEVNLQ